MSKSSFAIAGHMPELPHTPRPNPKYLMPTKAVSSVGYGTKALFSGAVTVGAAIGALTVKAVDGCRVTAECACGKVIVRTSGDIKGIKSCGCQWTKNSTEPASAGDRFGKLTVIREADAGLYRYGPTGEWKPRKVPRYNCACDCGGSRIVNATYLRKGWTIDCGCGKKSA